MSVVIPFARYHKRRLVPPLVFVAMSARQLACSEGFGTEQIAPVLAKCRMLLERTRGEGWPVAFVGERRRVHGHSRPLWIEGLAPQRRDMVFEATGLSCYTSPEFADAMAAAGNAYVLAGFSGESACLSTLIDAPRHGHNATFIQDASATRPLPGYDAEESHRAVTAIAGRYATIVTAERWLEVAGVEKSQPESRHDIAIR